MIKLKNNKLRLISSISIAFFSAFACASGALAWFVSNKNTNNTNSTIVSAKDPNIVSLSYSLYRYDFNALSAIKYEQSNDLDLSLNQYDDFIHERNVHNNALLRFDISFDSNYGSSESKRKLNFNFESQLTQIGSSFDSGIEDEKVRTYKDITGYEYQVNSVSHICNNISNVIGFKILPYSYTINEETYFFNEELVIDEEDDNSTYVGICEAMADVDQHTFVDEAKSSDKNSINLVIDNIDGLADSVVIYLEYNYVKSLIDAFMENNEYGASRDADQFASGQKIDFQKDIEKLTISSGESDAK